MLGGRNSQPAIQEWQADSVYIAKKCCSLTRGRTDKWLAAKAVSYTVVSYFFGVCVHVLHKWSWYVLQTGDDFVLFHLKLSLNELTKVTERIEIGLKIQKYLLLLRSLFIWRWWIPLKLCWLLSRKGTLFVNIWPSWNLYLTVGKW